MAQHFFRHPGVGVGIFAEGEQFLAAEEAAAARNGKGGHHAIADLQIGDLAAHLNHLAHKLMSQDIPGLHGGHQSVVEVQIGAANRGGCHFQDDVAAVENFRVRNLFHANISGAVPTIGLHESPPYVGRGEPSDGLLDRRLSRLRGSLRQAALAFV
jgi:hypothetical protein